MSNMYIPDSILIRYAETKPKNWVAIKKFAVSGFVEATGLSARLLDNIFNDVANNECLEKCMTSSEEDCAKITAFSDIYLGAQYLEALGTPFPAGISSSSIEPLLSIEPITKSVAIADLLLHLSLLIKNDEQVLAQRIALSKKSIACLCIDLKRLAPKTTATTLLGHLLLNEPLLPRAAKKYHLLFAEIFGESIPQQTLADFAINIARPN